MALDVVDFHGHWFPPSVVDARRPPSNAALAASWPLLTNLDAQVERATAAGTAVKVVNAVYSSIAAEATVRLDELPARANDALAEGVARHGGRVVALATIDAWRGDAGAEEARRAVDELGLPGLVVDVADGERLLSDPEARPVLAFAAERGIPVFAHPVGPPVLGQRYTRAGAAGVLLARGSESAISTLVLLADGTLAELDGLNLTIAGIGAAALFMAVFLDTPVAPPPPPSVAFARLHVDTMGFDPKTVRWAVDVLGPDHVLLGSDWPILWGEASTDRVTTTLDAAGLDAADAALVAGANARRLLRLPPALP